TWLSLKRRAAGCVSAQTACALGQRVRKAQPDGGDSGLGISPDSRMALAWPWLACEKRGTAAIRARVYGCRGVLKISSRVPVSTTRPRYITATEWLRCRTTLRSCEINR